MKKRWLFIGIGVLVVAAMVVANMTRSKVPTVKAKLAGVERGEITAHISAPGRVRAVSSVDISAEVPGRIIELRVAEGDSVTQGDLLLRLDDVQFRSRVEQAEASIRSARANLALSEARLEKFQSDKNRREALHDQGLASAEAVERAQTDHRVQFADVEARRQDVAAAAAAVADTRDDLEKTVYRAPVAGIVSRLNVEQGEIVITGTMNNPGTVILTIADLSRMEVEAEVDETDVINVQVGQHADISVDAIPDTTFAGTVVTVGNSGRRRGQGTVDEVINFEVKVRFDDTDPRLKPGMTADIEVETMTHAEVLTVPIQALVARSRGQLEKDRKEMAKERGSEAETSPVDTLTGVARTKWEKEIVEGVYKVVGEEAVFVSLTTGIADESRIEVRGDLTESDQLVSGPFKVLRGLQEGVRVKELGEEETQDED